MASEILKHRLSNSFTSEHNSCEQVLNKSSIAEKGQIKNYNLKMLLSLLALYTISQFYGEMRKIWRKNVAESEHIKRSNATSANPNEVKGRIFKKMIH
jgi:hypothetical protein